MVNAVFRIVLSGIGSLTQVGKVSDSVSAIGAVARSAGIDGFTLNRGYGWTAQWGREDVSVIETAASQAAAETFVSILCTIAEQECAYVTVDGANPALWYADGRQEAIHPIDSDAAEFLSTVRADSLTVAKHLRGLPCDCGYCADESAHDCNCDCDSCVSAAWHAGDAGDEDNSPHGRTSDRDNSLPRKPAVY